MYVSDRTLYNAAAPDPVRFIPQGVPPMPDHHLASHPRRRLEVARGQPEAEAGHDRQAIAAFKRGDEGALRDRDSSREDDYRAGPRSRWPKRITAGVRGVDARRTGV